MMKIFAIGILALSLAGCTVREQQLATAGVAGAVIGSTLANPRPVYVEEPQYMVQRPYHPRCYTTWERTYRGAYIERRICN